jgi:NAD+ kinase
MPDVKRVGIVSKPGIERAPELLPQLVEWLHSHGRQVRCDEQTANYLGRRDGLPRVEVPDGCELVVVLGGDGTLLSAARALGGRDIPLFAVNLGGLGFLTAITADELFPELDKALKGQHRIAQRRMLHCEVWRGGRRVSEYEAMNDVVLTKAALARMIEVEIRVSRHFVAAYRADGLCFLP